MRRLFKMPPQVFRIVLLAVGIVVAYSVARYFLTPPSFGEYGWYRGAALAELATRDRVYAGKKACEECHADEYEKLTKHEHKSLSCESCHGPGEAHVRTIPGRTDDRSCITAFACGATRPTPRGPKWHKQIVSKNHYPGKCTECHVPHSPFGGPMKKPVSRRSLLGQDRRGGGGRAGRPRGQGRQGRGAKDSWSPATRRRAMTRPSTNG